MFVFTKVLSIPEMLIESLTSVTLLSIGTSITILHTLYDNFELFVTLTTFLIIVSSCFKLIPKSSAISFSRSFAVIIYSFFPILPAASLANT